MSKKQKTAQILTCLNAAFLIYGALILITPFLFNYPNVLGGENFYFAGIFLSPVFLISTIVCAVISEARRRRINIIFSLLIIPLCLAFLIYITMIFSSRA